MTHPLPRFHRHQEAINDTRNIDRIIAELTPTQAPATVTRATLSGDTRRLRGIPAIGYGISGASPGTNPSAETERRLMRQRP